MLRVRIGASCGLRWGLFGLATVIAVLAVSSDPADARARRKKTFHRHAATSSYNPGYSAIVVDGNSGAVLHAANADALRHPASLTKIMTLYLLFERLDSGKLKLDSQLQVSEHAADQSPTKLGLKAGATIAVEDAIKGMVTRSANDAAVVVAESLGGSESEFARMMTRKAQALGMTRTVYKNASGLPDDDQVTTARDQAILGRAIQERFPRHYAFFSIRKFSYRGQSIGNHNRLLGRVEGVDGIKTGYTRASGFNLVTSVRRDKRHVVAVVLGGTSAGARDARMRALLDEYMDEASTKRTAPMIAEGGPRAVAVAQAPQGKDPQRYGLAGTSTPVTVAAPAARPSPGSTDPIRPVPVKTVNVKPGAMQTASAAPVAVPSVPAVPEAEPEAATAAAAAAEPPAPPKVARAGILGVLPMRAATGSVAEPAPAPVAAAPVAAAPAAPPKPQVRSGWVIQVGAYPAEDEAKQRLATVKNKAAKLLAAAEPFTETVLKDGTTYYRARFAGLGKEQAEAACKYLKRNDVDCLTVRN